MRNGESGFTIIELLVVVAIIGILAALAIPNYALFKVNAQNSMAASDARNASPAAELVASSSSPDRDFFLFASDAGPVDELPGATKSEGTVLHVFVEANHYTIEAHHDQGTLQYRVDSSTGWSIANL